MVSEARQSSVGRVVDYLSTAGVAGMTLRSVAAGTGTSHRMLIYHFGSLDGMVKAVVVEVERRQREYLATLTIGDDMTLRGVAMAIWQHVSEPELHPLERLFFSLYGRLLQESSQAAARLVENWLEPVGGVLRSRGVAEAESASLARLALAVTRGLLLDLLATGDREAADAAMFAYASAMYRQT